MIIVNKSVLLILKIIQQITVYTYIRKRIITLMLANVITILILSQKKKAQLVQRLRSNNLELKVIVIKNKKE